MKYSYFLIVVSTILLTGCYDDQALLNDPTIHPVENAEDKVMPKTNHYFDSPRRGYRRHYNGYYYYDNYYYYNGYYHRLDRRARAYEENIDRENTQRENGEIIGNGHPLSYQDSYEGIDAREADGIE